MKPPIPSDIVQAIDAIRYDGFVVLPAYIDRNQHMNIGYYSVIFDQALDALDKDREFLTKGGVFTNDLIDAYIELKMQDVTRFRMTTHPIEFDMYYSV